MSKSRSAEEYRQDADRIRTLADQVSREEIRYPLLGMAELCEHLARRADMLSNLNEAGRVRRTAVRSSEMGLAAYRPEE